MPYILPPDSEAQIENIGTLIQKCRLDPKSPNDAANLTALMDTCCYFMQTIRIDALSAEAQRIVTLADAGNSRWRDDYFEDQEHFEYFLVQIELGVLEATAVSELTRSLIMGELREIGNILVSRRLDLEQNIASLESSMTSLKNRLCKLAGEQNEATLERKHQRQRKIRINLALATLYTGLIPLNTIAIPVIGPLGAAASIILGTVGQAIAKDRAR